MNVVMGKICNYYHVLNIELMVYKDYQESSVPEDIIYQPPYSTVVTRDWIYIESLNCGLLEIEIITKEDYIYKIKRDRKGVFYCNGVSFFKVDDVRTSSFGLYPSVYGDGCFELSTDLGAVPQFYGSFASLNGVYKKEFIRHIKGGIFMLLVRKISCTKCKYRNGGDERHIYACNFERCKVKDNSVEVLDTEDGKVETYSIDEFKGYLFDGVEVDNVEFEEDDSMTILR